MLHPRAFFPCNDGRRYESKAHVLRTLKRDMRVKPLISSVALKHVAIPRFGIRVLGPDVRQLVLIQLQHLLQRGEVPGTGFAEFKGHEVEFLRLGFCGPMFELNSAQAMVTAVPLTATIIMPLVSPSTA